jgi:hypothetical protein
MQQEREHISHLQSEEELLHRHKLPPAALAPPPPPPQHAGFLSASHTSNSYMAQYQQQHRLSPNKRSPDRGGAAVNALAMTYPGGASRTMGKVSDWGSLWSADFALSRHYWRCSVHVLLSRHARAGLSIYINPISSLMIRKTKQFADIPQFSSP